MEISVRRSHTLVVSVIEQYVKELEDALQYFRTNLSSSLGPRAISAIADTMPPLPPQSPLHSASPLLPIPVPDGISDDDVALTVEKIGHLDSQHDRQFVEIGEFLKVIEYWTWVLNWAHPPLYDFAFHILSIAKRYDKQLHRAVGTFRRDWERLRLMVLDSPSAASPRLLFPMLGSPYTVSATQPPPPLPLRNDCLPTIQEAEELRLGAEDYSPDGGVEASPPHQ